MMTVVKKERNSNIELLRIAAMMMVLILHCTFLANGGPSCVDLIASPFGTFYFSWVEALCLVCVDVYVLISGYFGIKPTIAKFFKLYFIVVFWRIIIYAIEIFVAHGPNHIGVVVRILNPFCGEWFVGAYFGLFILSPFLNAFIDNTPKNKARKFIGAYLLLMLIVGWIMQASHSPNFNFANGNSFLSFIGLYLIGRYIARYINLNDFTIRKSLFYYLGSTTLNAIIFTLLLIGAATPFMLDITVSHFISYDSIFTIVGAVALLIAFTRFKFQSKFINWLAASSFTVYLIHCNPFVLHFFLQIARDIKHLFWPWGWLPIVILYSAGVYLLCTIVDQVRLGAWKAMSILFQKIEFKRI